MRAPSAELITFPANDNIERVAICVCTAYRPRMLESCLLSLMMQLVDATLRLDIVVVDNEPEPNNQDAVASLASLAYGSVYPIHYVHQPKRGIAAARNAALTKALELRADWIAFLDDDEVADEDWIAQLMAEEYRGVPVLSGAVHYIYPTPLPFWASNEGVKGHEGQSCKTAYTGNVRFTADIARAGLRFDERLGLMGGEDNELFARVHAAGWEIRRTMRAITREAVHPERLTYGGQVYRAYWCSASEFRRLAITRGWLGAALRKAHTIPLNLVVGVAWLASAVLMRLIDREAFRTAALEGGKKLAKAAGRMAALFGIKPQPYARVRGR